MLLSQYIEKTKLEILTQGDDDHDISGGYCGDLLSWVMGRAPSDSVWFTVMGNVNAIAVAVLADVACIVLVENAVLDDDARARAEQRGVTILRSSKTAYDLSLELSGLIDDNEL